MADPPDVTIKVDVVRVEQLTGLLNITLTGAPRATPAAPREGTVESTWGGVVSGTLMVSRPQPAIEMDRSVSADKNQVP
jgi:hypothetical protein